MDQENFDDLTRSMASGISTRRQALRALGGALLGGVAARLGLTEFAEVAAKQHTSRKRASQHAPRSSPAHQRSKSVHVAGKGKHKGRRKNKSRQHDKKPQNSPSPPCEFQCPGGPCVARTECCPGEKKCVDRESPTGFSCLGADACCPDQKKCAGGCVYRQACCPEARPACGPCDEALCVNGAWVCSTNCCSNEKPCTGGTCVARTACCPGEKPCPDGECIPQDQCCPNEAPPVCGECEVARCVDGSWGCWPDETCGPRCGEGYCPKGMTCRGTGVCCGVPEGGTYSTCVCASGYTNHEGCNAYGQCCRTGCCYPYCCEDPRAG
jgi:hypothetical protein